MDAECDGGWRALHIGAGHCDWEVVEILLGDPRVDFNSCKGGGKTHLHVAARLNRLGAVRLLP